MTHFASLLNKISEELFSEQQIPLFGEKPTFPQEAITEKLKTLFSLETCSLEVQPPQWQTQTEAKKGLGRTPHFVEIVIPSFSKRALLAMGLRDVKKLMQKLLGGNVYAQAFYDPELRTGFLQYCLIEMIDSIEEAGFLNELGIQLDVGDTPTFDRYLTLDIHIVLDKSSINARLLLPSLFYLEWKAYTGKQTRSLAATKLEKAIPIDLKLEIGSFNFTSLEWEQVEKGDFILLEECSINQDGTGQAQLVANAIPLFQSRLNLENVELEQRINHG